MPKPKTGETKKEYMDRCIPMMIEEGMENKQAMAACASMFGEKKGLFELPEPERFAKAISLNEKQGKITTAFMTMFYPTPNNEMSGWVQEIYDVDGYLIVCERNDYYRVDFSEADGKYEFTPRSEWTSVEREIQWIEKALQGNHLKTISKTDDELRVANYIVLFGGRDLEWLRSGKNPDGSKGEFFTEKTDFESSYTKAGVFHIDWEHGAGKRLDGKDAPGEDDVLGVVDWRTAKKDSHGIWVERALSRRNEYVKLLEELIDNGLVGTSSQAVSTGIKRNKAGEILKWPLRRDTLTFTPAEPRMLSDNALSAIKTLSELVPDLKALLPEAAVSGSGQAADSKTLQLQAEAWLYLNNEVQS